MSKKENILSILLLALSMLLLLYTGSRAVAMSITHDEASSYVNYGNLNVFSCFFSNKDCWWMANNHLLNTLLFQISTKVFGATEWGLRFPNLLGHAVYLYATAGIVRMSKPGIVVGLAGFILLNFNPYLLDFFSLARGYGLSVSFMTAALFALFLFIRRKKTGMLGFSLLLAFLSVMANFTALLYFCSHVGVVFLMVLYWKNRNEISRADVIRFLSLPGLFVLALTILLWFPIRTLHDQGEFEWGISTLYLSFEQLVRDALYNQNYLADDTVVTAFWICVIFVLASIIFSMLQAVKDLGSQAAKQHVATTLIFILIIVEMLVQHYALGSEYLEGRKSILFMPLAALLTFQLMHAMHQKRGKHLGITVAALLLFVNSWHFGRSASRDYCREWWYDVNTRDMVEFLGTQVVEGETVQLGVNWLFHPAAEFYRLTRPLDYYQPLLYSKQIRPDLPFDYYYVDQADLPLLQDQYDIIREYNWGRYLLKRKPG